MEGKMKKTGFLVFCIALVMGMTGFPAFADIESIKIGMIGPMSGPCAFQGASMKNAAEMAVAEINQKGGIQGKKIELNIEDDESTPVKAVNAAQKLVTKDRVLSVVGHYNSSCTLASMEVTQRNKVPHMCPISVAAAITGQGHKYIFRNCATNPMQINQLADYVFQYMKRGAEGRVAEIYEQTDYGKGIMEIFKGRVEAESGWQVAALELYKPGDTDMIAQLTKIKASRPGFLLLGGNMTEVAQIVRQAREVGLKTQLLALGGCSNDKFAELAGKKNIEGMTNTSYFETTSKNPLARVFVKAYRDRYDTDPDMFAAAVYEAFYILEHSINKTGVDYGSISKWRKDLRNAIAGIQAFPGVQGPTTYGEDGQADKKVYIVRWENGRRVIIYPEGS